MGVTIDGRRERGDASRRAILERAADIASVDGLDGLTLGRLAEGSGRGKSSIATLFGSKESLQLATVQAAAATFRARVIEPARALPYGVGRLSALLRGVIEYSRQRVFTGGCFFAAAGADVDSKPGPVRDAVRAELARWRGYVEEQVRRAGAADGLAIDEDRAELLAFELLALYDEANARSVLTGSERPYALAAAAMRERLRAVGAREEDLRALEL